jgi:hypothetical protein
MSKGRGKRREGKVVTGGHHTKVEGLAKFLPKLEVWPEITHIRLGAITVASKVGRSHRSATPGHHNKDRAIGSGGGFSFKANDWARAGEKITGIRCTASHGRAHQDVILSSGDLRSLRARLILEGYLNE